MKKNTIIVVFITLLAGFLRFYRLGDVPVGLHRDEAFLGYNAYSILKTGRDINGLLLPLHLKSFLYSPAGYSYATLPFVAIFGLSAFSIRFASALFGTLTIPVTYFLVKTLFAKEKSALPLGLLSSLLIAVSPWHINLSRTATENIVAVFFICLGIILYLMWSKKRSPILLGASFLALTISLLLYQAPRVFLVFFLPLLIYLTNRSFGENIKKTLLPLALFFLIIFLPIVAITSSRTLSLRFKTVSIFSTGETQLQLDEFIREDGVSQNPVGISRFFHNKAVGYTQQFLQNYFAHFSYPFLFTDKGLPDRYRVPGTGLLYLVELPLLIIGLYELAKQKKAYHLILLSWLFIAPIGSAIAFDDVPNLQRTAIIFPALSIVTALGLRKFLIDIKKFKNLLIIGWGIILLGYAYGFTSYLHSYYIHQLVHRPWFRHEGYQSLTTKVNAVLPSYTRAIVTNRESAPTIFFLFFGRYDPARFQAQTRDSTFPDYDRINFGPYEFSTEECPLRLVQKIDETTGKVSIQFNGQPNVLYVNSGLCKTPVDYARELDQIKRGDGSVVFRVVRTK